MKKKTKKKPSKLEVQHSFSLQVSETSAAVLLRCLSYGQAAISEEESDNGIGELLNTHIEILRKSLLSGLGKSIITNAVAKYQ